MLMITFLSLTRMTGYNDMMKTKDAYFKEQHRLIKRAWILDDIALVSFHEIDGANLFEAEEDAFWGYILELIKQGYRVQ